MSFLKLTKDLEWKIIYVGNAQDKKFDQELEAMLVGPVSVGKNKFVLSSPAPNPAKIPKEDLVGSTVILVTCTYKDQEFLQIGYYVSVEYNDEALRLTPPAEPQIDKLTRNMLAEKPRVTLFPIDWRTGSALNYEMNPEDALKLKQNDDQANADAIDMKNGGADEDEDAADDDEEGEDDGEEAEDDMQQ